MNGFSGKVAVSLSPVEVMVVVVVTVVMVAMRASYNTQNINSHQMSGDREVAKPDSG